MQCKTRRGRLRRAIGSFSDWCRRHRHRPIKAQHEALKRRLIGHFNYFGVNGNMRSLQRLYAAVKCAWYKWLRRRGQRRPQSWERFDQIHERYPLPRPQIRVQIWATT
jgi:RNA-directed DNA polymerase